MCTSVEGIEAEVEANNFGVQMLLQLLKLSYKMLSHYAYGVHPRVVRGPLSRGGPLPAPWTLDLGGHRLLKTHTQPTYY